MATAFVRVASIQWLPCSSKINIKIKVLSLSYQLLSAMKPLSNTKKSDVNMREYCANTILLPSQKHAIVKNMLMQMISEKECLWSSAFCSISNWRKHILWYNLLLMGIILDDYKVPWMIRKGQHLNIYLINYVEVFYMWLTCLNMYWSPYDYANLFSKNDEILILEPSNIFLFHDSCETFFFHWTKASSAERKM